MTSDRTLGDIADQLDSLRDGSLLLLGNTSAWIPMNTKVVTATYSVQPFDKVILANATGGAFTVTLPSAVGRMGQQPIVVKRTNAGANAVTLGSASGTIDGAATQSLGAQYVSYQLVSDGTNWHII